MHHDHAASGLHPEYRQALVPLAESYRAAVALNRKAWDFALQLASLYELGVTDSQLRCLICQGLAEHRFETGSGDQDERTFSPPRYLRFSADSCFVLTEAGCLEATRLSRPGVPAGASHTTTAPFYDAAKRILYFAGETVKHFRVPATNQELILMAFEEEDWPPHISDPLPGRAGTPAKRRLNDAIKNLNANQHCHSVRFRGDGRGLGVLWESLR
jgi:hypothetical protein